MDSFTSTKRTIPTREECLKMLEEYGVEIWVVSHAQEVSRVAETIAKRLNSRGWTVDIALLTASSLLHDIAKGQRDHPRKGQEIVAAMGYPEVADIIACHMELPEHHTNEINEYSILYLADKMVQGNRLVSLEARLSQQLANHEEDAVLRQVIQRRMENALRIKHNIERVLNLEVEHILGL